ncbi:MAG: hypothetical protein ACRC20_03710 [Segniliparus sp.]|uniref:hypothetical protein n=1 Tax=Segniliparus sp. TaxID=2804064 RepID=UPI003F3E12B1
MTQDEPTREQMRAKLDAALPKYDDNGIGPIAPGPRIMWKIGFFISCFAVLLVPFALFDETRQLFQGRTGAWNIVNALGWYCLYLLALEQVVEGVINKLWRRDRLPRMVSNRRTWKIRYGVFAAVTVVVIVLAWWLR